MAKKSLTTGFTGDVDEDDRVSVKARTAIAKAKDEAGMVAAHAVDHPAATGSAVVAVGLLGLVVGYFLGATSAARRSRWN
jgi:dihydropteroate synthase